jgi:flagellar hook-basal body complex protein FliE
MISGLDSLIGVGRAAGSKLDFGTASATGTTAQAAGAQASFAAALGDLTTSTVSSLQQAEQMSVKALQGETDTRAVVDAVMSAEQSLQTAIAIRDKIVSAYLEVSRMAI